MDVSAQNKEETETEESEFYSAESDMEDDNDYIASDALYSIKPTSISTKLNDADINMVDNILEINEKISLIYLLYNNPHIALDKVIDLLRNGTRNMLQDWCNLKERHEKLLESLTIIQNFKALRKLGFNKDEMILRFSPMQPAALFVNLVRKYCYRVCEDFNRENTERFLSYVEQDFKSKDLRYRPKENVIYNKDYLEMYFLYLESERYISLEDIHNIPKIFKYMDNENLYDNFQKLSDTLNKKNGHGTASGGLKIDKMPSHNKSDEIPNDKGLTKNFNSKYTSNKYDLKDPKRPGLLLIINNEFFYTELRKEYLEKLPPTDLKLENRKGTHADGLELKKTFSSLGFEVKPECNKIHDEMLTIIEDTVKHFNASCLFIAILSHGSQGVVYGANSIPVEISQIQQIMCQKHLRGIPKVLLLQSCQGSECQKIADDEYEIDSPRKPTYTPPKTTDLLTFRATIPGFGAVRHKKEGTWFIQTLCSMMKENPDAHFQDICTKVIKHITMMEWNGKCMVPIMETTFTKELYLNGKRK